MAKNKTFLHILVSEQFEPFTTKTCLLKLDILKKNIISLIINFFFKLFTM